MFEKGAGNFFMEIAVVLFALIVVGFLVTETLIKTAPEPDAISGTKEERERRIAELADDCYSIYRGNSGHNWCVDKEINSSIPFNQTIVEQLSSCPCSFSWNMQGNYSMLRISYIGENNTMSMQLLKNR